RHPWPVKVSRIALRPPTSQILISRWCCPSRDSFLPDDLRSLPHSCRISLCSQLLLAPLTLLAQREPYGNGAERRPSAGNPIYSGAGRELFLPAERVVTS